MKLLSRQVFGLTKAITVSETFGAPKRNSPGPARTDLPQNDPIPIRDTSETARSINRPLEPGVPSVSGVSERQTSVPNTDAPPIFSAMPPPDQRAHRDQSTFSQAPTNVEITSDTQLLESEVFNYSVADTEYKIDSRNVSDLFLEIMDELEKNELHWKQSVRRAKTDADRAAAQNRVSALHHLADTIHAICRRRDSETK